MEGFEKQEFTVHPGSSERSVPVVAQRAGSGDRLALFLHGLGCLGELFEGSREEFSPSNWTLLVPDFPGHGRSPAKSWYPYTPAWYRDVMMAVLREVNPRLSMLLGHSMGGLVSLLIAEKRSSNPFLLNVEGCPESLGFLRRRIERYGDFEEEEGLRRLREEFQDVSDPGIRTWVRWTRRCDANAFFTSAKRFVELWAEGDPMNQFRDYPRGHRFYVCGERGQSEYVRSRLEPEAFGVVAGAGHFPMVTHPEAFWTLVSGVMEQRFEPDQ